MNWKFSFKFFITAVFLVLFFLTSVNAGIDPTYLRVEYKVNPFVDEVKPRLSWELVSNEYNQYQSGYQIIVASSVDKLRKNIGDLWDSGKVVGAQTNQIYYGGKALASGQKAWWKVRVWDERGKVGRWSTAAFWETGKLVADDWRAKWIGVDLNHLAEKGTYHLPPSPYLRKSVNLGKTVKSARLYISSLGLHNFYINGKKVGTDYFGSGWTDYNKRVYYQVYDVSDQLEKGDNVLAATLGSGWYAGYLGYALLVGSPQVNRFYGEYPLLKAQLDITYADGTKNSIITDQNWKYSTGAILEADFLQGETYDARKLSKDWNRSNFIDQEWKNVQEIDNPVKNISLYPGQPVRVVKEIKAKSIRKVAEGRYIVDFGQNFAGNIRLQYLGKAGQKLVFRYGELCHPDGSLMTENLRRARATDTYILNGDRNAEIWSPSFTFHGFQYVEVTGLTEEPTLDLLTGLVLSSDLPEVGTFSSDNSMLNQLYSNIVWTQRANYLDIPTDCPQRDERLGWTGDAQVYMRSALYNTDIATFHKKWIRDLNDAQWPNGAFPIYAPMPVNNKGVSAIRETDTFSPGWSEAGIVCAYEIFRAYNDTEVVKSSMPYMLKYMDFLKNRVQNNVLKEGAFADIDPKGGFADWLSIGEKTSPDLLATVYYNYCAKMMEEMCDAIGNKEKALYFHKESENIQKGFKAHYMDLESRFVTDKSVYGDGAGYVDGANGFSGHTQTAYANAIYGGVLNDADYLKAGKYLRQLVELNGDKLTTGFLGFKPLLPALSNTGSTDKAYALLLSTTYPSLGYEVVNGATSIWERWDSFTKDKGFVHNAAMNSFSHYAFGSVNEWIYEHMIGIKAIDRGYQTFQIKPELPTGNQALHQANGSFRSLAGTIKSGWTRTGATITYAFTIPVNTTAFFELKAAEDAEVSINTISLSKSKLIQQVSRTADGYKLKLGSGSYKVVVK